MTKAVARVAASVGRWYGATPLHLLALAASLTLTAYAAVRLLDGATLRIIVWFVGAAIVHDLLLFPLYAVADAAVVRVARRQALTGPDPSSKSRIGVPWVNHVRFPAVISGTLLIVWFPLIFRLPPGFRGITGYTTGPYLERWLLVTGALFLLSALAYAVRLRWAAR